MTNVAPLHRARPVATAGALGLVAAIAVIGVAVIATRPAAAASSLPTVRLVAGAGTRDTVGVSWRSDHGYASGGRVVRIGKSVARTGQPRLFRTARAGTFSYRIPVRPGVYTVRINTVAMPKGGVGRAAFRVRANGVTKLAKVDALHRAGVRKAYSRTFAVTVRGNRLTLSVTGRHGGAVTSVSVVGRRPLPQPPAPPRPTPKPTPKPDPEPTPSPTSSPVPTAGPTSPADPTSPTSPTTSPTSAPPTAGTPTAADTTVTPESFGAKGDGTTDDAAALQRTFAGAAGRTITLTAGRVYAFRSVLHLAVAGLHVTGAGTLLALDEAHSDVWLDAAGITLDGGLTIATKTTTKRWETWDQMGVRLGPYTGITLRNVTVSGSAAAGVYVGGSDHFTLDHVTVQNTRADGIHMTAGASYGTVVSPVVSSSGDDGVAVVSYQQDGTPCHDITVTSPRVLGTTWGRGLSVVGGRNITETDVYVADTSAAGIYLAAEGKPWYTAAPSNVLVSGGTILRANKTTSVEHGAVLVLSGESDVTPDQVTVRGLTIRDTVVNKRNLGVITYGAAPHNVLFDNITITGGTAAAYEGNTDQSAYKLRSITMNGTRLPDKG